MTDPKIIIENPDAPVNLGPDPIEIDGVIENVPEDPNPVTEDIYPKPTTEGDTK